MFPLYRDFRRGGALISTLPHNATSIPHNATSIPHNATSIPHNATSIPHNATSTWVHPSLVPMVLCALPAGFLSTCAPRRGTSRTIGTCGLRKDVSCATRSNLARGASRNVPATPPTPSTRPPPHPSRHSPTHCHLDYSPVVHSTC